MRFGGWLISHLPALCVGMTDQPETQAEQDLELGHRIRLIRGHRVLLDADLAALYGVPTKRLNEQVRRNIDRFPHDFIFALSDQEVASLRSQFATLKTGRGTHRKYAPMAFTEHGAIMTATILNSPSAVEMSVHVVRAFVKLRQALASNAALARRLEALEKSVSLLDTETRKEFTRLYKAILRLVGPPPLDQ
jgi:phage regulator Rha-like protein